MINSLVLGYFATQTFFTSVKKRRASSRPSRPVALRFMPPNVSNCEWNALRLAGCFVHDH